MKVSILIPVFNSAKHLAATIDCALAQTWPDKEIILVDDGSTDDSLAIAKSYVSSGVKVFSQPTSGACRARNKAFAESCGSYIQYLDADDLMSPDKIAKQMALLSESGEVIVLSCSFARFRSGNELPGYPAKRPFLDRSWDDPLDWLVHEWEGKGMGQTSIWLTPRHLIEKAGPWNERLSINQDGEFFCRVLLSANAIRFCPDCLVYYRSGNTESVSQSVSKKKAEDLLLSYQSYAKHALEKKDSPRVRLALARKFSSFIYGHFDSYPDLAREARNCVFAMGVKRLPDMGGRNFKLLAMLSGFENALKIRSVIRKISSAKVHR